MPSKISIAASSFKAVRAAHIENKAIQSYVADATLFAIILPDLLYREWCRPIIFLDFNGWFS
ncbi:MAG: hypothetical protein ACKO96_16395, partial [Flammeovirgaceae bacterium]